MSVPFPAAGSPPASALIEPVAAPRAAAASAGVPRVSGRSRRRAAETGIALAGVVLATAVSWVAEPLFEHADQALVYILAVLLVSLRVSRFPALVSVLAGVASFDWFFVEPRFTFNVADPRFAVTFCVMLTVGLTVSTMTVRIRGQAEEARERERRTVALYAMMRELLGEEDPARLAESAARHIRDSLEAEVLVLLGPPAGWASPRGTLRGPVEEEARRLARLVNNLLDLTRLESGTFRVRREWCPLEEIVGSALGRTEEALRGREVRVDLPEDLLMVPADPVLLEQVLVNLLENAARYSPAGTPVGIRGRALPGAVEVEVADRGPGVPSGEERRVFEPFFRGAGAGGTPGSGLGLAVCEAILRVHGGTIEVRRREGGGAVLRFVLPREGEAPAVEEEA